MSESRTFTYQTRIEVSPEQAKFLDEYAETYSTIQRHMFAEISAGKIPNKSDYLRKFVITARQYNAVAISLKGKIAAIKALKKTQISNTESKIKKMESVIKKLEAKIYRANNLNRAKLYFKIHQKKRRQFILETRLANVKNKNASGKIGICFGSKKLFHAQFFLGDNGYKSHQEWKIDWQSARNSEFFVLGSKDESAGCQGCVANINSDDSFNLRLRLPNPIGKYISFDNLSFAYGQDKIIESLQAKRALSYRFKKDKKGWRVFLSTAMERDIVSVKNLGAIGVDQNANCLAVSETDRFGNLIATKVISCVTHGKTTEQTKAIIGDAVKQVSEWAKNTGKPVAVEKLDFSKKKLEMGQDDPKQARMLSNFAYSLTSSMIYSSCFKNGTEVIEENPAYTSIIGSVNYAQRFGISVHQAAALAIARRGMGLSERPTTRVAVIPTRNGAHVTFALPVRNRAKHVWSFWSNMGFGEQRNSKRS
ncbi:MAG: IS200/IS605 family accessory protein TnpB-related protein [Terrimicrobiaceae bacterium]